MTAVNWEATMADTWAALSVKMKAVHLALNLAGWMVGWKVLNWAVSKDSTMAAH